MKEKKADVCIEVSFECGNKVGGIYTVLVSKARKMKEIYKDNYITIGFFNPEKYFTDFEEEETPEDIKKIFNKLKPHGIVCHWGKWISAEKVRLILVDSREFMKNKINEIKGELWENFGVDSLRTGHDYEEPVAWARAVGMLIEELVKLKQFSKKKIVVHCHEWLSGPALLYLYRKKVPVALVFTTHATRIGRAKSLAGEDLFKEVVEGLNADKRFNDEDAKKYFLEAQHMIEKNCAKLADVFTTVSEIVAEEAKYILDKKPDIITINGLDLKHIPSSRSLTIAHEKNRRRINDFIEAYFSPYYPIETKNNIVFFISGRYEFRNKGIDLFIEALGKLNERLKKKKCEKSVVAFILIPSQIKGPRKEVLESILRFKEIKEMVEEELNQLSIDLIDMVLDGKEVSTKNLFSDKFLHRVTVLSHFFSRFRNKDPPICAYELNYDEKDDMIIQHLIKNNLTNKKSDVVKVVFYPSYVSPIDGLLNMDYYDFVNGASMGVFPSRYEPWGYTPCLLYTSPSPRD